MPQVRKFSTAGRCVALGDLERETVSFLVYRTASGERRRIGRHGLAHTEPCRSCADHPDTLYPSEAVLRAAIAARKPTTTREPR